MRAPILVINAGSSSIKFSVFETAPDRSLVAGIHGQVESIGATPHLEAADASGTKLVDRRIDGEGHNGAIVAIHEWFAGHIGSEAGFDGVGHRVVHGGLAYAEPVLIDDAVVRTLEELAPLAPLHQPHNIAANPRDIGDCPRCAADRLLRHRVPSQPTGDRPAVRAAARADGKGHSPLRLPRLSYEYIVSALPKVASDRIAVGKVVVAHLGNGASMCAIEGGRSIASTMGFTAVDGLPMGTRTGALDPGVILYLLQHEGMDAQAIERLIYQRSGLLGVSGISSDMRTLLASDAPSAREAVDLFVYRIGRELGSLAAALGGLDALVFTGGIGEHAADLRARVCQDARWLGLTADEAANANGGPCISTGDSKVSAWVVPTDENLMIARRTRRLLDG